jgi:hypothetical protein
MCRENKYVVAIKKYIGKHTDVLYSQKFSDLVNEAQEHRVYVSSVVMSNIENKIVDFCFME